METKNSNTLIDLKSVNLNLPVLSAKNRSVLSNPLSFLSDLYLTRMKHEKVAILKDISFELYEGESLGLIGRNGAGKTTLLQLLAGVFDPSSGDLSISGSVKGLFNISLGMLGNATGLENIYLRGLQMGIKLKEIKQMVPEIIEFSELGESINNPFYTYSTGMRMRLSFAISTIVSTDILLMDEWIGVGDELFREKVKNRMGSLVENSKSLVLASHNNVLLQNFCSNGLVLEQGRIAFYGKINDALDWYTAEIVNKGKK